MPVRAEPLVTVVVPVRDGETYLDSCLASLRVQSYQNLEIVVVDDASIDSSLDLVRRQALEDSRVRIISLASPLGLSNARNVGIDEARGEYLMFADSDDMVAPDLVARCIGAVMEHDVDLVLFGHRVFYDNEDEPQWVKVDETLPDEVIIVAGSTDFLREPQFAWLKCVKTEVVRRNYIRFPVGLAYEDRPFHWALWMLNVPSVRIMTPLYGYRQRAGSITSRRDGVLLDQFAIQELILGRLLDRGVEGDALAMFCEQTAHTAWYVYLNIEPHLVPLTLERIASLAAEFPPEVRRTVSQRSQSGILWHRAQRANGATRWLMTQFRVVAEVRRRVRSAGRSFKLW